MMRATETTSRRIGFTLIELLVVITLIVIVIGVTAPSISRLIESANFSTAVNKVTGTLGRARSLAMQEGQHMAVAFLYDTETNIVTLQVLQQSSGGTEGKLTNSPSQRGADIYAAVYMPARLEPAVELPEGMAVFGFSPFIEDESRLPPSETINIDEQTWRWYANELVDVDANIKATPWIFPRNDPRWWSQTDVNPWDDLNDTANVESVRAAQTFCVVFSPDGSIAKSFSRGSARRLPDGYVELTDRPILTQPQTEMEEEPFDDETSFDPEVTRNDNRPVTPNPEYRIRTATQLAIVSLEQVTAGTGIERPWLVRTEDSPGPTWPGSDRKSEFINDDYANRMSRWIDQNGQLLTFNRYTGNVVRR